MTSRPSSTRWRWSVASYRIIGNTYEHRDAIRSTGAKWDKTAKVWILEVVEYQLRKLPGLRVERAT